MNGKECRQARYLKLSDGVGVQKSGFTNLQREKKFPERDHFYQLIVATGGI